MTTIVILGGGCTFVLTEQGGNMGRGRIYIIFLGLVAVGVMVATDEPVRSAAPPDDYVIPGSALVLGDITDSSVGRAKIEAFLEDHPEMDDPCYLFKAYNLTLAAGAMPLGGESDHLVIVEDAAVVEVAHTTGASGSKELRMSVQDLWFTASGCGPGGDPPPDPGPPYWRNVTTGDGVCLARLEDRYGYADQCFEYQQLMNDGDPDNDFFAWRQWMGFVGKCASPLTFYCDPAHKTEHFKLQHAWEKNEPHNEDVFPMAWVGTPPMTPTSHYEGKCQSWTAQVGVGGALTVPVSYERCEEWSPAWSNPMVKMSLAWRGDTSKRRDIALMESIRVPEEGVPNHRGEWGFTGNGFTERRYADR